MITSDDLDVAELTVLEQAIVAAKAGNRPLARLHLEEAVVSEPDNADIWLWLAWTADSPAGALSALDEALRNDPDNRLIPLGLAWARGMCEFERCRCEPHDSQPSELEGDNVWLTETRVEEEIPAVQEEVPAVQEEIPAVQEEIPAVEEEIPAVQEEIPAVQEEILAVEEEILAVEEEILAVEEEILAVEEEIPAVEEEILAVEEEIPAEEATLPPLGDSFHQETLPVSPFETPELQPPIEDQTDEFSDGVSCHDSPADEPHTCHDQEFQDLDNQPQCQGDQPEPTVANDQAHRESPRPIILAVDDSPTIRKLVSMTLTKRGYDVKTAPDGVSALEQIAACRPELILMDIKMPRLDGYQLCKLVKKHAKTNTIPVIMLSGKDGVFDKMRGKMVGCDSYITKPFESAELVRKVSQYVPLAVSAE